MQSTTKSGKKFLTYILIFSMILTLVPMGTFAVQASDIDSHWAKVQIQDWLDKKLINGYPDGSFKPDNNITRAEFMVLVNAAFGYEEKAMIDYSDVKANDWFADAVAKAKAGGYIGGYPDGTMKPNNPISREEAAAIIQKISGLSSHEGAAEKFTDKSALSWSKGAVGAVALSGIMGGYPDGSFKPQSYMKRAEAVVALNKAFIHEIPIETTMKYDKAGIYGPTDGLKEIYEDVEITAAGVTLQNMVIHGNLTITPAVGDGEVYLKGLTVKGDTIVKGGGLNSIYFENTILVKIIVNKADGKVRIVASGSTAVQEVTLESGARLEEINSTGKGFEAVSIEKTLPKDARVTLLGSFETVEVRATAISVEIPRGTVENLKVDGAATDTKIDVAAEAKILAAVINAIVEVLGKGTVAEATVNISGVTFEKEPGKTNLADGVAPPKITTPTTPPAGGGGGGGGSTTVAVTGVTLNKTTAILSAGGTLQLTATVAPSNATNKNVTWSSSDEAIATVSSTGLVTAVATGSAIITAASAADGTKKATATVNVVDKLTVTSTAFENGEAIPIKYTRYGANTTIPLTWNSIGGATNYAILMYDTHPIAQDPEFGPFIHWAVTGITSPTDFLSATEYRNWFMQNGYGGPEPPPGGIHTYKIVVYALNDSVEIEYDNEWEMVTKTNFENSLQEKILASGELTGTYGIEPNLAELEFSQIKAIDEDVYDEEGNKIGTKKVIYKEYILKHGDVPISIQTDHIQGIFVEFEEGMEYIAEYPYENLLVDIEMPSGEHKFTVIAKDGKAYEATLNWIKPEVSAVEFTDTDTTSGEIGGTISWNLPADVIGIEGYRVYFIDVEDNLIGTAVDEVASNINQIIIPNDTRIPDNAVNLGVVCYGAVGNFSTFEALIEFRDDSTGSNSPIITSVTDEDTNEGIDGRDFTVNWTLTDWAFNSLRQDIYILPSSTILTYENLAEYTPVDSVAEDVITWTGGSDLMKDSEDNIFTEQEYRIWIIVYNVTETWTWMGVPGTITPVSDLAPLSIEWASTFDKNSNGTLDSFLIKANRPIDDATVLFNKFSIDGATVNSFDTGNTANDAYFWIDFTEAGHGTGDLPALTVEAGAFEDLAGLGNLEQMGVLMEDGAEPVFIKAEINGTELVLTYSEVLDTNSIPEATDFIVEINDIQATVISVGIVGSMVTLTLETAVESADTVTVSYTSSTNPLQDEAENTTIPLIGEAVDNKTL